jgi:ATP-binding cassette subfamily C protein LapB
MVDRACKAIDNELSLVFFGRALSVRMDARPKSIGTFAAQIKQFEMVRNFMTSSTLFVMADLPCSFIFILMIWYLAGSIAIIPIIFMPLVALIAFSFTGSLKKLALQHQSESNQKNGLLIESVDGIESLKAAMGEWKMLGIWKKLNGLISSRDYKIRTINSFSTNLTQSLQQAAFVLIIILGALSIGRSEITVGALIACSMIIGRALNPINQLPLLISQWQSAKVALADLDKILSLPIDNSNQKKLIPDSCNGDLRFENLKFFYSQDNTALDIQSLNIKAGERIAILGAIGSGKSTLLKILSGLFKPNEGRSLLDGIDMQSIASDFLRQKIGYLPQEVRLFHGSLRDNLVLGLHSPTDEQIIQACRFTGLDNLVSNHPDGLDLSISEGGRGLSGGQRQLAGLTRLFISNPNVILLDEPTASMDEDLEKKLMSNLIKNIESNTTLVFVTHKLSMLLYATRIIVLDRGKILFDGPSSEILKKIGFFPNSERVVDESVKQSMVFS